MTELLIPGRRKVFKPIDKGNRAICVMQPFGFPRPESDRHLFPER